MTRPLLREFQIEDAVALANRDGIQCDASLTIDQAMRGPAFSAEADGMLLGCGGVVLLWPGVGACWMVLSADIGSHGLWLTKVVRDFLHRVRRDLQLHRLEAMALHESVRNQKWLELCGFTREDHAVARAYLPDKRSMVRYEWVEDSPCKQ